MFLPGRGRVRSHFGFVGDALAEVRERAESNGRHPGSPEAMIIEHGVDVSGMLAFPPKIL
jgi:hypothetical protein